MSRFLACLIFALICTRAAYGGRSRQSPNEYDRSNERDERAMNERDERAMNEKDERPRTEREERQRPPPPNRRVWALGIGRAVPPIEELDQEKMQVVGISTDMMHAACKYANQECVIDNYADYRYCWEDSTQRSMALDNRWFDACVSWVPTPTRSLSYSFTGPFVKSRPYTMYARRTDGIDFQDLKEPNNDIAIGFFRSSWMNTDCLRMNGAIVSEENAKRYADIPEMFQALLNGEVRLILAARENDRDNDLFKEVMFENDAVPCTTGGHSVMTRKDSVELLGWLGPAIEAVMRTKDYADTCYVWSKIFGEDAGCFDVEMD